MRNISEIPCTVEDCDKPSRTRGWCSMHYNRYLRNGDPALKYSGTVLDSTGLPYHVQEKVADDGFWAQVDKCRAERLMQV